MEESSAHISTALEKRLQNTNDEEVVEELDLIAYRADQAAFQVQKQTRWYLVSLGGIGVLYLVDMAILVAWIVGLFLEWPRHIVLGLITSFGALFAVVSVLFVLWALVFFVWRGRTSVRKRLLIREKNKVLSKAQLSGAVMLSSQESSQQGKLTMQENVSGRLSGVEGSEHE